MRFTVAVAVACFSIGGVSATEPVRAAIKTFTNIPAQPLGAALHSLARDRDFQVLYRTELVGSARTEGVLGELTVEEALNRLLSGTGLGFEYLDEKTVRIVPLAAQSETSERDTAIRENTTRVQSRMTGEGGTHFRNGERIRLAQVDGRPSESSDSSIDQDEIIVTGTAEDGYVVKGASSVGPWQGRTLQNTPYSVTVISKDLVKNLQVTAPDQIYRIAPTTQFLTAQSMTDQSGSYMRGFLVNTPYTDGLPGNALGHGTTIENIERVEIFTGLSGFLYGPGNVGGMINYVSKRPTAKRLNTVTLGNSGGSSWYAQGDFGGKIDSAGRLGYRINGIWQDGETSIDNTEIKKRFISGAFDWRLTDTLLWQFDAVYREYEADGGSAIWTLAPGVTWPSAEDIDPSMGWSPQWMNRSYKTRRYGTQLRWDASDVFTLRAAWQTGSTQRTSGVAVNTVQSNGTYDQIIIGQYAPGDNPLDLELFAQHGNLFADLEFDTGRIAHKLTAGAQYSKTFYERFTNSAPNLSYPGLTLDRPTYFDKPAMAHVDRGLGGRGSDVTFTTLLIGDDITLNSHWSLLAGVAHSTIDVASTYFVPTAAYKKSAVTPNVSLLFKPVEAVTTYATYIEALQQGSVAGPVFNGLPVVNAGEVMDPLISNQIEIGAKWSLGGMLLTTALFQIDKALQYYDLSNPAAVRFVQDGLQVHRGVEFTAFGKLTQDLTLTGGFTLLDAKVEEQKQNPALEGKRPTTVAEKLIKLRAEYRLPFLPALSLSGGVIYTSDQYGDVMNTGSVPSSTLFDIGARYQTAVAQRPLTLRMAVNNLTDEAYWQGPSYLGEPRTVLFSVSTEL